MTKPSTEPLARRWLIPQDGQVQVMVCDAIAFNGKRFVIGLCIGRLGPAGVQLSPIGQMVADRLAAYTKVEEAQIWLVELAHEKRIELRLRTAFVEAPQGAAILLLCHTSELVDQATDYLPLQAPVVPAPGPAPGESADDGKPDVLIGTFNDFDDLLDQDDDVAGMILELGGRGHFGKADVVRASEALLGAVARMRAEQVLVLVIGGYDDDRRELHHVPDVVRFVRRVMQHAGITHWSHPAVRMLNESSLGLLVQCGVFGKDHPFRVVNGRASGPMLRRFWPR